MRGSAAPSETPEDGLCRVGRVPASSSAKWVDAPVWTLVTGFAAGPGYFEYGPVEGELPPLSAEAAELLGGLA